MSSFFIWMDVSLTKAPYTLVIKNENQTELFLLMSQQVKVKILNGFFLFPETISNKVLMNKIESVNEEEMSSTYYKKQTNR